MKEMSVAKSLANGSVRKISEADMEKACTNFSVPNMEKKEFYSPNYPHNYPSNLQCTLVITAKFGHLVQLDFRDKFCLEESKDCMFDRLEVRDGPYGYSQKLKIICGCEFPSIITSSDRYLWLQFVSDESIEESGFRAVYDFIEIKDKDKRPEITECVYRKSGSAGTIRKSRIEVARFNYSVTNGVPIDCMWVITAEPGRKIYFNFVAYKLGFPNDCDKNYIEIYATKEGTMELKKRFCGTSHEPLTTENIAHIRYFTDNTSFNSTDFQIHYTVIRELQNDEDCDEVKELNCGDQTCIDKALRCDGNYDCKYMYDEDEAICVRASVAGKVLNSKYMIAILIVFFALVIAMCGSISISCYHKVKERQMRQREYKQRRSKEASVEATTDRTIRGHTSPDRNPEIPQATKLPVQRYPASNLLPDDEDDESSDGCYVPEVNLGDFNKYPNNAGTVPRVPRGSNGRSISRGGLRSDLNKQYPFISRSSESLQSETIVPPVPPPVPMHLKERRDISPKQQEPLSYRFVGGKAVPDIDKTPPFERRYEPTKKGTENLKAPSVSSTPMQRNRWPPESRYEQTKPIGTYSAPSRGPSTEPPKTPANDPKMSFLTKGPLEAGVSRTVLGRSPGEYGLPRFGVAKPNPEGVRGPLGRGTEKSPLSIFKTPESYNMNPYRPNAYRSYKGTQEDERRNVRPSQFRAQATIESSDRDSSRPDSVDSAQSAPDVIAPR